MATNPNTLVNRPLNDKDRLISAISEFFKDSIYINTDPRFKKESIAKWDIGAASWVGDDKSRDHFVKEFAKKAVAPLLGEEWVLRYPKHYFNPAKDITTITAYRGLTVGGGKALGFWIEAPRVFAIQLSGFARSGDDYQWLRLPIHEYTHSKKVGLETGYDFTYFKMSDWFKTDQSKSKIDLIRNIRNLSLTPGLANLYDKYVTENEELIANDKIPWFIDKSKNIKDAYIYSKIVEEIYARSTADVAVSNARHDDINYLFQPGIEKILSDKFIRIIKDSAWPRLKSDKPDLLNIFKDFNLWD
jgi:hypothetical protein